MEQELATEATAETAATTPQSPSPEPGAHTSAPSSPLPPLETWSANDRMRHVPLAGWMAEKLDHDVRQRLEILSATLEKVPSADPRHAALEQALRSVCAALDLLAHAARHSRNSAPANDLIGRISSSLNNALTSVRAIDANTFGRRSPYNNFERSKAECVYAALLVVLERLDRVLPLAREADPAIDERLLQGLVNLETPMRQEKIA